MSFDLLIRLANVCLSGFEIVAQLWDQEGIQVWFFPRSKIPADITTPNPATWGTPVSDIKFGGSCTASHFKDHTITINTSICGELYIVCCQRTPQVLTVIRCVFSGDWAGSQDAYAKSGCPTTCADAAADPKNFVGAYSFLRSGRLTVVADRFLSFFTDAQWEINYIHVYQ